jgi:hypothetical protein
MAYARKQQILIESDNFLFLFSLSLRREDEHIIFDSFLLCISSSHHRCRYLWIRSFSSLCRSD